MPVIYFITLVKIYKLNVMIEDLKKSKTKLSKI